MRSRQCKSCNENKSDTDFPFGDKEKKYRKHICKSCEAIMRSHREKIVKAKQSPDKYFECHGDCGQVWAKRLGGFCRRCGNKGVCCAE